MIRVYYYSTLVVMLPHSKSVKVRMLTFISVFAVMLVNNVARSRGSYRHQSWFQMLNRHVEKCAVEGQRRPYERCSVNLECLGGSGTTFSCQ